MVRKVYWFKIHTVRIGDKIQHFLRYSRRRISVCKRDWIKIWHIFHGFFDCSKEMKFMIESGWNYINEGLDDSVFWSNWRAEVFPWILLNVLRAHLLIASKCFLAVCFRCNWIVAAAIQPYIEDILKYLNVVCSFVCRIATMRIS